MCYLLFTVYTDIPFVDSYLHIYVQNIKIARFPIADIQIKFTNNIFHFRNFQPSKTILCYLRVFAKIVLSLYVFTFFTSRLSFHSFVYVFHFYQIYYCNPVVISILALVPNTFLSIQHSYTLNCTSE